MRSEMFFNVSGITSYDSMEGRSRRCFALLLFVVSFVGASFGQNSNLLGYQKGMPAGTSEYIRCSGFRITKPLRELQVEEISETDSDEGLHEHFSDEGSGTYAEKKGCTPDPVVQQEAGYKVLDTLMVNVDGGKHARPDATGAAGPNHYVQGVNFCSFKIFNKQGILLLNTSMTTISGSCSGDPIVIYDKFADRWLLTSETNNYTALTIAVSATSDPTGSYYVYTYTFPVMPDFPKYSVWSDGYYATFKNINLDTVGVAVFDRVRMLKGDASAGMIKVKFPNSKIINANNQMSGAPKILDCDGALPPFGRPNYLMYYTNVNCGDPTNSIMIYKLQTDTVLKKCTLSFVDSLATAPFNAYFAGAAGGALIREPGNAFVWPLDGTFQYRVPYMRFTGYNSVVLCNTVNLGGNLAGIRWYELRQNDTTLKWSIYQQGTFGPNDNTSRWNSSICMDDNGAISLAYNVTNSTNLYPGIRYTGRLASDPIGQMTVAERTVIAGTHSMQYQWGDFSQSSLDPDGVTFWHTNQYFVDPSASTSNTRIFSFRLTSSLTGISPVSYKPFDLLVFQEGDHLNVNVSGISSQKKMVVDLFDMNGRRISSQWVFPQRGKLEAWIGVVGLGRGVYLVRVGNDTEQRVAKVLVE